MKKLIVIVEDEPMMIAYYARVLAVRDYNLLLFTKATECYKFISEIKHCDAVLTVIMDLKLKDSWSGYELGSAMNLVCPHIPLIAVSGFIGDYQSLPDFDKIFKFALQKSEITMANLYEVLDIIKQELAENDINQAVY